MSRKKAASTKRGSVIRIAALQNPKTKRTVFERVTADGRLSKRAAAQLGIKRVEAWKEVEARTWAAATKLVRAGKGKAARSVRVARSRTDSHAAKEAA